MSDRQDIMTPQDFAEATGVSRETLERLEAYAETLVKWQARINLVGNGTLPDLWRRHFFDSAQIHSLLPVGTRSLLDLGTGAGFPGMVLAIMGVEEVHLVDSDSKKCVFLREVARITGTRVQIHQNRIEKINFFPVDVITSRALAPLGKLLNFAQPFLHEGVECIFLKGKTHKEELTDSEKEWHMNLETLPSRSDESGVILHIREISRVGSRREGETQGSS